MVAIDAGKVPGHSALNRLLVSSPQFVCGRQFVVDCPPSSLSRLPLFTITVRIFGEARIGVEKPPHWTITGFRNPPGVFPGKFAIIAISSGAK
jgi:hypothetical protein